MSSSSAAASPARGGAAPRPADEALLAQSLSPRVEDAIRKVLGAESDELDGPTFDAVAFVNAKFGDEKSLSALDRTIVDYDDEIKTCVGGADGRGARWRWGGAAARARARRFSLALRRGARRGGRGGRRAAAGGRRRP